MSDANRVAISYEKEGSTYGTVDSPTQMEDVRYTGESLAHETNAVSSAEIRSDRQVPDVTRVGVGAGGDVNVEMSYAEHDDWFESALLSATWSSSDDDIATGVTMSVDGAGVYTRASGTWTTDPPVGSIVEIRGFANAVNNGYHVVTASTTSTFTIAATGTTIENTVASVVIDVLSEITNGTTFASYHVQKHYTDLGNGSDTFALMTGGVIDGWSIEAALESIVTEVFTFIGKSFTSPAPTSTFSTRAGTTSNEVMNVVDHIPTIGEGSTHTATDLINFSLAVANNARSLGELGKLGAQDIGLGKVDVSGNIQLYFEDNTIMDKYTGNTASELIIVFEDTLGNGYVFYLPQVKYTSGPANAGGQDTDVIGDFGFIGYRNSTYDYTIKVARFAA